MPSRGNGKVDALVVIHRWMDVRGRSYVPALKYWTPQLNEIVGIATLALRAKLFSFCLSLLRVGKFTTVESGFSNKLACMLQQMPSKHVCQRQ